MGEAMVVIRPFQRSDAITCKEIINEGTLSTVHPAFFSLLFKEVTLQLLLLVTAVIYIFVGIPFYYTGVALPIVVVIMYVSVWMGHIFKTVEMHQDVDTIERSYMSSDSTCFWVAELYEPHAGYVTNAAPNEKPLFVTPGEFEGLSSTMGPRIKTVVGTVAITKKQGFPSTAWLRRMAVRKAYHKRGIASHMLDVVIRFCHNRGYSDVELLTTEFHQAARETYLRKGFEIVDIYNKYVLANILSIGMCQFQYNLKGSRSSLNI